MAQANNKVTIGKSQNVSATLNGNILTLTIDISKDFGLNESGKTIRVGTVGKPSVIPGTDVYVGLNVFKYPQR